MATEEAIQQAEDRGQQSVKVDRVTYDRLAELAREQHIPMAQVLGRAVDTYDRVSMAEESNAAYARLRLDPAEWAAWQSELDLWATGPMDGLQTNG